MRNHRSRQHNDASWKIIGGALLLTMAGVTGLLPAAQVTISKSPSESLKAYLRSQLSFGKVHPDPTTRITVVGVKTDRGDTDLDIVYVSGQRWCGSGSCTMLILEASESSFRVLGRETIVQLPIRLLPSVKNGYPEIGVGVEGGGILPGYEAVLSFNGKRYPGNPSVPPARKSSTTQGKVIIATTEDSVPPYE